MNFPGLRRQIYLCSIECRDRFKITEFTGSIQVALLAYVDEQIASQRRKPAAWMLALAKKYDCPYFEMDSDNNGRVEFLYGITKHALSVVKQIESMNKKNKCCIS